MMSELFASIDGVEGVGIRAFQLIRELEDSLTCYPKRMFISGSIAVACAVLSTEGVGEVLSSKSARDSGRYNGTHPFFLTKLCLIPPSSP